MEQRTELVRAFYTPILIYRPSLANPDFLDTLQQRILKRRAEQLPGTDSLINNWQSSPNLLEWDGEDIATLKQIFSEGFGLFTSEVVQAPVETVQASFNMTAWASVIRDGAQVAPHNLFPYQYSAVLYLSTGSPEPTPANNGCIEFADPRCGARMLVHEKISRPIVIRPEPGMLLVFPAWLNHHVHPFRGKGERVSIACNTSVQSLSLSDPSKQPVSDNSQTQTGQDAE